MATNVPPRSLSSTLSYFYIALSRLYYKSSLYIHTIPLPLFLLVFYLLSFDDLYLSLTPSVCAQLLLFYFIRYPGYHLLIFLHPAHIFIHIYPAFGTFIWLFSYSSPKIHASFIPICILYSSQISLFVFSTVAGKQDKHFDSIDRVEVRRVPQEQESKWLKSFGTFDRGGELMSIAWHKIDHIFAV